MLAPVTHILPLATVQRQRVLPVPGRVLVRKGQEVAAADAVADVNLTPQHVVLDVARGLGLPPDRADKQVQRKAGERISEDDVIAGPVGITKRVVRAPRSGRIIVIGSGQVLLEVDSPPFELRAGIPGEVVSLIPERGVVIENTGALVQGVWGNGRIDFGLMHVLASRPEASLTADQLDVSFRGSMILGGYCGQPDVLSTAADLPLRGLILSSMASSLVPLAAEMPYPIIIIEGFGLLPMNSAAFSLLSTSDRRQVAINAEAWDRFADKRPEVFIPLPSDGRVSPLRDTIEFAPDQRVRVVRAPQKSQIGTIVALLPGMQVFPSGVQGPAAQVRLENGEESVLPLANLEVLV
jgi:hypothetical protein